MLRLYPGADCQDPRLSQRDRGDGSLPSQAGPLFAVIVIIFELTASALVISGVFRWAAALALAAFTLLATGLTLRFWELPKGADRSVAMNAFFEHLGLVAAFVLVAIDSIPEALTARF